MRPSQISILIMLLASVPLLSPSAIAQAEERVIYAFSECGEPIAPLITDSQRNLYGTTTGGGAYEGGCVFELSPVEGGGWSESVLLNLDGVGGAHGALVFDKAGNLYGTGPGIAFELSPSAEGGWSETVLHSFGSGDDGSGDESNLIFDDAGNLYGTTSSGGARRGGTVFELSPGQDGWRETILYSFPGSVSGPNGDSPAGGLVVDREGRLYGVTEFGGAGGDGAVFELVPSDGGYKERLVHSFDINDGLQPTSGLAADRSGNLYGTTSAGGDASVCYYVGCGIVFELTRGPDGNWTEKVLHELNGSDGFSAVGPPVIDPAGNVYAAAMSGGIQAGSVFELTPTASGPWKETVLHLFDFKFPNGEDGESPYAGVTLYRDRAFGTTSGGGVHNAGTAFEIIPRVF